MCEYYEYLYEFTDEFDDDPDKIDIYREVKYSLKQDLPVKRAVLY